MTTLIKKVSRCVVSLMLIFTILTCQMPAAPMLVSASVNEFSHDVTFLIANNGLTSFLSKWFSSSSSPFDKQESPDKRNSRISYIKILPENLSVPVDHEVSLNAIGYDSDGWPVGAVEGHWSAVSADSNRAEEISNSGRFIVPQFGKHKISVSYNGLVAETDVTAIQPLDGSKVESDTPTVETCNSGDWDSCNWGSSEDPENQTGNPANSTDDEGIASGNFKIEIPVLSTKGRGLDLDLSLNYNSRLWNKSGSTVTYDIDRGWPAAGWTFGFEKFIFEDVKKMGMMISGDGTRRPHTGTLYVYDPGNPQVGSSEYFGATTDGTSVRATHFNYLGGTPNTVSVYDSWLNFPDGKKMNFHGVGATEKTAYPWAIWDADGNRISFAYKTDPLSGYANGPNISEIVDTVGRVTTFHYDSNNLLTAITVDGIGNKIDPAGSVVTNTNRRTVVRFHYKQLPSLQANAVFTVNKSIRQDTPWALDAVFFPATNTGYWFGDSDSYSPYGMISTVREQRGMSFVGPDPVPASQGTTEQGTVVSGTTTRQKVYNYAENVTSSQSNAPVYTKQTETWEGMDTGAAITEYSYQGTATNPLDASIPSRKTRTKNPDGTEFVQWTYRYPNLTNTDPNKFKDGIVYMTELFASDGTTLLRRQKLEWEKGDLESPRVRRIEDFDNIGQSISKEFGYGAYNQRTSERSYDYNGNLITDIRTTYVSDPDYFTTWPSTNPTNVGRWIINLPLSIETFDANNNRVSSSSFSYDEFSLAATPGSIRGGSSSDVPVGYSAKRGHLTTNRKYGDAGSNLNPIVETKKYDATGNMVMSQLENTVTKNNFNVDTQYAYPSSVTKGSPTNSALQNLTTFVYDFNTGLKVVESDPNGRLTRTFHYPSSLRPHIIQTDLGAWEEYIYDDAQMSVKKTQYKGTFTPSNLVSQSVTYNNGLGKEQRKEIKSENSTWTITEKQYDNSGRPTRVSTPYKIGETKYWTESLYDQSGRVYKATSADGSFVETFYNETTGGQLKRPSSATPNLKGQTQRTRDAWGNEHWRLIDARGKVLEIAEPNANGSGAVYDAGNVLTKYSYDALGNLIKTEQGSQVRLFKYDSLNRLTHQKMAERQATLTDNGSYVGEGSGGVWSDVFIYNGDNLAQSIDARGVKTIDNYGGDPLNRLQSISYDLSAAHQTEFEILPASSITMEYKTSGDLTKIAKVTTASVAESATPGSIVEFTYDAYGRQTDRTTTIAGSESAPISVGYTYDIVDTINSVLYPKRYGAINNFRRSLNSQFENSGLLSRLDVEGSIYASQINYNSAKQPTSIRIGESFPVQTTEAVTYDSLTGLMTNQKVIRNGSTLLDMSYDYLKEGTSGNRTGLVTKIVNNIDRNQDRAYSYDTLNRLKTATGGVNQTWTQNYSYDNLGNKLGVTTTGFEALRQEEPSLAEQPALKKLAKEDLPAARMIHSEQPLKDFPRPTGNPANVEGSLRRTPKQKTAAEDGEPLKNETQVGGENLTVPATPFDFDGDGKADFSTWQRTAGTAPQGTWTVHQSQNGQDDISQLGNSSDQIAPGDYDGDGKTDKAVWNTNTGVWTIKYSSNGSVAILSWGIKGDSIVPYDYDGDGKTDIAVWRPSTGDWYITKSSNGSWYAVNFGGRQFGDIPVVGDYDGDGRFDITVWRPSGGDWYVYVLASGGGQVFGYHWGMKGDVPFAADFDGDHISDLGVWRPSQGLWYVNQSSNGQLLYSYTGSEASGDVLVPADYDGDGKADIAVWTPSTGNWTVRKSTTGTNITYQLGSNSTVAVPSAYVRRSSNPTGQSVAIQRDGYQSISYDSLSNRISSSGFQYDAAGNQTRIVSPAGSITRFQYDAAGRMVKVKNDSGVTQETYFYGSDRKKIGVQTGIETSGNHTYYSWEGDKIIAEFNKTSTVPLYWTKSYIYMGSRLLATQEVKKSNEFVLFHHPDKLGTRLVTSPASTSYQQTTLPFGGILNSETTGTSNRVFTTYDRSAISGMDYAINRFYDSSQGRFTQPDSIGMKSVSLENPQSLNQYAYVQNDPINKTDPDGNFIQYLLLFGIGAAVGALGYLGGTAIGNWMSGRPTFDGFSWYGLGISAAAGGLFAALAPLATSLAPTYGVMLLGGLLGMGQYTATQYATGGRITGEGVVASGLLGAVGGLISGNYASNTLIGGLRWQGPYRALSADLEAQGARLAQAMADSLAVSQSLQAQMRGLGGSVVSNFPYDNRWFERQQAADAERKQQYQDHLRREAEEMERVVQWQNIQRQNEAARAASQAQYRAYWKAVDDRWAAELARGRAQYEAMMEARRFRFVWVQNPYGGGSFQWVQGGRP